MSDVRRLARRLHTQVAGSPIEPAADRRIRAALQGHAIREHRPRTAALIAVAASLALVFGWALGRSTPAPAPEPARAVAVEAAAEPSERCEVRNEADRIQLDGFCRHRLERLAVETSGRAEMRPHADGVHLVSGWATFDVEPVRDGRPVEVLVSDGRLQVLGTRFVVHQGPTGGHVDLIEGSLRFVSHDGATSTIVPGVRFAWGASAPPTPPREATSEVADDPAPTQPRAPARPGKRVAEPKVGRADPLEVPLDRIMGLRAAGRHAEAVALIRTLDPSRLDRRTAEVLSYEEGTLLQEDLDDRPAACRHWRQHLRQFPTGRYRDEVTTRQHTTCD